MIEALEPRIAPAAVVTFFETDGDKVTVKTSKGTQADLQQVLGIQNGATGVTNITFNFDENPQLSALFAKTNITITATKRGGDGLANAISIDAGSGSASDIDLGKISIKGELIFIDAGDADFDTPAVKSITVTSFIGGLFGGGVSSAIRGDIGSLVVKKDFNGFILSVEDVFSSGGTDIGSITVGGDFASFTGPDYGHLSVGDIGKLVIRGTFFGPSAGANAGNGLIEADSINKISIGRMSQGAEIALLNPTPN